MASDAAAEWSMDSVLAEEANGTFERTRARRCIERAYAREYWVAGIHCPLEEQPSPRSRYRPLLWFARCSYRPRIGGMQAGQGNIIAFNGLITERRSSGTGSFWASWAASIDGFKELKLGQEIDPLAPIINADLRKLLVFARPAGSGGRAIAKDARDGSGFSTGALVSETGLQPKTTA